MLPARAGKALPALESSIVQEFARVNIQPLCQLSQRRDARGGVELVALYADYACDSHARFLRELALREHRAPPGLSHLLACCRHGEHSSRPLFRSLVDILPYNARIL